jgi:hypothetical protein
MPLPDDLRPYLLATLRRILPDDPRAEQIAQSVEDEPRLEQWLVFLRRESWAVFGQDFLDLHESTQDELLDRIDAENYRTEWRGVDGKGLLQRLVELTGKAMSHLPKGQQIPTISPNKSEPE